MDWKRKKEIFKLKLGRMKEEKGASDVRTMEELPKPHFFKVMHGEDFHQRLRIPQAFLEHIAEMPSEKATIRGASGSCWHVKLNKSKNGMFFTDGWESFSRANSLSIGEFLVFGYDGNMNFSVRIFGTSTLEREDVMMIKNPEELTKCEEIRRRGRPPKAGRQHHIRSSGTTSIPCNQTKNAQHREECAHERPDSHKDKHEKSAKGQAIQVEEVCKLEHPYFTIVLKPSYGLYVPIPVDFSKCYLTRKAELEGVKLVASDGSGTSMKVRCVVETSGRHRLTSGWKEFKSQVRLKDGKPCVFELISDKDIVLKVQTVPDA